jgi:hypothetical protein
MINAVSGLLTQAVRACCGEHRGPNTEEFVVVIEIVDNGQLKTVSDTQVIPPTEQKMAGNPTAGLHLFDDLSSVKAPQDTEQRDQIRIGSDGSVYVRFPR